MKKSTVIKLIIALIIVMILFWMTLNFLKNKNEQEEGLQYNYFILFKNEKMGVIDKNANIIIEPDFDNIIIPNPSKDVFVCSKNEEKTSFLNKNSEELFLNFEEVSPIEITGIVLEVPYEKKILKFKQNDKYGLIDYSGNVIVEAIYEEITGLPYKSGELKIKKESKYGVISVEGKELIKAEYDYIEGDKYYSEENKSAGYVIGIKNEYGYKYGYLDKNKKQVLDIKYNNIERVFDIKSDDVYLLAFDNGKGAIIKNKKEITSYEFTKIEKVESENLYWVEKAGKYGILDLSGKFILNPEYDELYVEGVNIFAKKDGENYVFDLEGKLKKDIDYAKKYKTGNENYYITVNNDGLYGVVDRSNNKIINNEYVYLEYAFGDCFIVSNQEGKTGVVGKDNNRIIDIKYDIVEKIQNGNIIQAVDLENSTLYLYNNALEKVYEGNNAQININEKYITLSNQDTTNYFDLNGNEINNIKEVTENTMPEKIGNYSKVYYSYGQVYYTDLQTTE